MKRMTKDTYGLFITFEGMDSSGKTTVMKKVAESLINIGYEVITTREPGGTKFAEELRDVIMKYDNLPKMAELNLFEAARADLMDKVIKPALLENKIVLCDRFIDSTVAYQGYANQLSFDANGNKNNLIEQMNAYALQNGYFPEATFFIDVDEKERQKRLSIRGIENRYDDVSDEYCKNLFKGFHNDEFLKRAFVVDNTDSMDKSHIVETIVDLIQNFEEHKEYITRVCGNMSYQNIEFAKEMQNKDSYIHALSVLKKGAYQEYCAIKEACKQFQQFDTDKKKKENLVHLLDKPCEIYVEDKKRKECFGVDTIEEENSWNITIGGLFSEVHLQYDKKNKNINFVDESIHIDIPSGERLFPSVRTKHRCNRIYKNMPLHCLENEVKIFKTKSINQRERDTIKKQNEYIRDCNYKYIKSSSKAYKDNVKVANHSNDKT